LQSLAQILSLDHQGIAEAGGGIVLVCAASTLRGSVVPQLFSQQGNIHCLSRHFTQGFIQDRRAGIGGLRLTDKDEFGGVQPGHRERQGFVGIGKGLGRQQRLWRGSRQDGQPGKGLGGRLRNLGAINQKRHRQSQQTQAQSAAEEEQEKREPAVRTRRQGCWDRRRDSDGCLRLGRQVEADDGKNRFAHTHLAAGAYRDGFSWR
jgi:hypothetical protein